MSLYVIRPIWANVGTHNPLPGRLIKKHKKSRPREVGGLNFNETIRKPITGRT
jgi:hypothetical protein